MFPGEKKETYFTPTSTMNKRKVSARGVLYEVFQFKRAKYIKLGLIEKQGKNCGKGEN